MDLDLRLGRQACNTHCLTVSEVSQDEKHKLLTIGGHV
jgi:hypothetical protein